MPTVLRENGFQVIIRTNDHNPAHVHVIRGRGEARIQIIDLEEGPRFMSVSPGMTDKEAYKTYEIVKKHQKYLLEKWKEYHD